jgi:glycosyltransferase involved in cell wall biosynthesis
LKIVHLTTHTTGGAGNFAFNIYKAGLCLENDQNHIISSESIKLSPTKRLYFFIIYRIHDIIYSILSTLKILNYKHFFFGIFPICFPKKKIINDLQNVDIFLIYWISRFLSLKDLKILKIMNPRAKFIFINTDEAHFTGGCHYKFSCKQYENSCNNCVGVNSFYLKKIISKNFKNKFKIYQELNPVFVLPSTTFENEFRNSPILKNHKNVVIPFGAISKKEKELFYTKRKKFLHRDTNKLRVLIRSSEEKRKGCNLFIKAIVKINSENPDLLKQFKFYVIGDNYIKNKRIDKLLDIDFLGFLNRKQLIETYSISDVLLVTSEEDSGPIMLNEASELGLYLLSTDVGVAKDLIRNNGMIFNKDSNSLVEKLINLRKNQVKNLVNSNYKSKASNDLMFEEFYKKVISL